MFELSITLIVMFSVPSKHDGSIGDIRKLEYQYDEGLLTFRIAGSLSHALSRRPIDMARARTSKYELVSTIEFI